MDRITFSNSFCMAPANAPQATSAQAECDWSSIAIKVAIVASIIIVIAGSVVASVFLWPVGIILGVLGGVVSLVALGYFIGFECKAARDHDDLNKLRAWHQTQRGVSQPWIRTQPIFPDELRIKRSLLESVTSDVITTEIRYGEESIPFSQELVSQLQQELRAGIKITVDTVERTFQDIRQKLQDHLPSHFKNLAEAMLLEALRDEEMEDMQDAVKAQIKREIDGFVFLWSPTQAAGNRQILFSGSDDKVTVTVKMRLALIKSTHTEYVHAGDIYLVSEFNYTKREGSEPTEITKSYRSRIEYV